METAIVIGSGIGGLVAGGLLARYGWGVTVCESHSIAGGAAHSFERQGFCFDSGPSFYCGLSDRRSLNPLRQVLDVLGESIEAIAYDPFGHYHFPDRTLPVYGNADRYLAAVREITPQGAIELARFNQRLLELYAAMRDIPTIALRLDWQLIPTLLSRYPGSLLKLLPQIGAIQGSVGDLLDRTIRDSWVRRLIDLECFLLSGLKADGTIAPEVAFMFGERSNSVIDYPIGGSGAIVQALVRGLERWGGRLRLNAHVDRILLKDGKAIGVRLRNGEVLKANVVISNASIWDTYSQLLQPDDLPDRFRQKSLETPAIDSFMHLHLGIRSDGLEHLTGHHVVVHSDDCDLTTPGNTCMISIPSVWDADLAPSGHHVVHAYTLEPFADWQRDASYAERKRDRAQSLYRALERVIPDLRDRIVLELIGTPLTHARYLRRHQGTYGAGIAAKDGLFPSQRMPIANLFRVGDSTLPGIGVPAVAASGILCANSLVSLDRSIALLEDWNRLQPSV
ncbi:FAD-dependent oxidoreductase [Microcoleus sp. FACHB-1515]|uniref:phytoene desaturase family protein n=1 Tax=Cyanophyceae TaxID=3028117 RepID=UPI001681CC8F|nr:NAD(P)/FAD-dependent oxidoreductase [Microcoleus sp. FACHB-1515]MBD2089799.1 FAD-dependent oxidoreductase [Microcoleus sp. FACHB-1515]